MEDKFTNGFISGILAGLAPLVINFGAKALHLNTVLWVDYFGNLILGRVAASTLEWGSLIIMQFLFLGILGAIFALLIPLLEAKKYLLLKGPIYGFTVWFILFTFPYLLQLPQFDFVPISTAITHIISSSAWGLFLVVIYRKISGSDLR